MARVLGVCVYSTIHAMQVITCSVSGADRDEVVALNYSYQYLVGVWSADQLYGKRRGQARSCLRGPGLAVPMCDGFGLSVTAS